MKPKLSVPAPITLDSTHLELVRREFGQDDSSINNVIYLNTGSVGRKPASVLDSINSGWRRLNINPTRVTYLEDEIKEEAREAVAELLSVDKDCLLLTDSTTQGLQLILQSLLKKAGDEVIVTDRQHGSTGTILRYLEDTRGIRVKTYKIETGCSTEQMSLELLNYITGNTRLVLISEIDCFSGWRPELTLLSESLKLLDIPLLVDAAHAPGNGVTRPSRFPLWVGAGHKWLGAPNSCAFAYISKDWIPLIEPVWIGDGFFEIRENEIYDLRRFELKGNPDVVKWMGLKKAVELYQSLDQKQIDEYQKSLLLYLRARLLEIDGVRLRNPGYHDPEGEESASMLAFYLRPERLKVNNLRGSLWERDKIWVHQDYLGRNPGCGARISCHYSVKQEDIDKFIEALTSLLS